MTKKRTPQEILFGKMKKAFDDYEMQFQAIEQKGFNRGYTAGMQKMRQAMTNEVVVMIDNKREEALKEKYFADGYISGYNVARRKHENGEDA